MSFQSDFIKLQTSQEQLVTLLQESDIKSLENAIPNYLKSIETFFKKLDKRKYSKEEIDKLKILQNSHLNLVNSVRDLKQLINANLKNIQSGKKMQNTYPKLA